jgi:GR25 family glycosyltransferase involved in LPS biosynthesis
MGIEFRNSKQNSLRLIPCYIINLASRTDRKQHVLDQISKFQLNAILLEAVSVDELEPKNLGFLTPPAMACWQSHLKVFESFLQTNEPRVVVFEDDFRIKDLAALERYIRRVNLEDFEIIQIGFLVNSYREQVDILLKNFEFSVFSLLSRVCVRNSFLRARFGSRLRLRRASGVPIGFVPDDLRAGAHAYILSRNAASRITNDFKEQNVLTADGFLIASNWTKPFRTLRLHRSFVDQIESPSSIR